jgi:hypothetical protein
VTAVILVMAFLATSNAYQLHSVIPRLGLGIHEFVGSNPALA